MTDSATPSPPEPRGLPADPQAVRALLSAVRPGNLILFVGPLAHGKETSARGLARAAGLGEAPFLRRRGDWAPPEAPFVLADANVQDSLTSIDRALAAGTRVFAIAHARFAVDGLLLPRQIAGDPGVVERVLDATTAVVGMHGFAARPCPSCSAPAPAWPGASFAGLPGARVLGGGCPVCHGRLPAGAIDRTPAMEVLLVDEAVRGAVRGGDAPLLALRELLHPRSAHGRMAAESARAAGAARFWTREEDLRLRVGAGTADVSSAERLIEAWASQL